MKTLPSSILTKIKRINANSKGIKVRLRKLVNGHSVYFDIHTNSERRYEQTNFVIYGTPEYKQADNHIIVELELLIGQRQRDLIESRNRNMIHENSHDVLLLKWFQDRAEKENISTANSVLVYLERFLTARKLENLTFQELDVKLCTDFYDFIANSIKSGKKSGKKKTKLHPNTSATYFGKFKAMLNVAVDQEIIARNPARSIKTIHQETNPDYLSIEEICRLINVETPYLDVKNAAIFSCCTGLRASDILQLRFSQIKDNTIHLRQTKTKSLVRIPLSEDANRILKEQRSRHHNSDLVFHLKSRFVLSYDLKKILKSIGLLKKGRNITFHSFRHTAAMQFLENNFSIQMISKLLGHSSLDSTMQYQKIKDKTIEDSIKSMPSYYSKK